MDRTRRTELPRWLSSASVAWMGALLAALAVALAAGFAWHESNDVEQHELHGSETLARVLADHADRTFNTLDVSLATLSRSLNDLRAEPDPERLAALLANAQQGLPFLRSLSLIDDRGRVLASSSAANVGMVLDPKRVPLPLPGVVDRLGPLVAGRDLADAAATAGGAASAASPRSFVPLVRAAFDRGEPPRYVVAAINTDYFANEHQLLLADAGRSAGLLSVDGTLLSATEGIALAPGHKASEHRFFTQFLPAHEQGSYVGPGLDGGRVVTAFRLLRQRPLAVLVEHDHARVMAEFDHVRVWVAAMCAAALLVIGAMAGMAWRSLRSHEAVRSALESSREQVASSERDLRTLVDSVHELIFRTDAAGRITYVNGRWEEISGTAVGNAMGRELARLCLPEDRPQVEALVAQAAAGGATKRMVRVLDARQVQRTLEVSLSAVRDGDGVLIGHAGFAVDVSERQQARERLQAQLDFTARLIEISPTPLFVKDRQGRFVNVNRAWLELMQLTAAQVIGRTSADLYGAAAPFHITHDERLMQSEERISYDNRLQRPDGEWRDTVVTKLRFTDADGSPAGIIGSIIDVTEFREAERTTREARDAAERSNRAKSEFIANMSHELRTPLQAIIGFSELGTKLAAAHEDFLDMFCEVHAGGRRMLTLVNALLDLSKLESTVGSLALHRRDLATLVSEVARELRPLAGQRDIELVLRPPQQPLGADVDAFRMQQVIRNVLANALRFAPIGSAIELDCLPTPDGGTEIVVRDHGPGIPADELESIFDAFVQSSRTADGAGGTGLGLTICRKIMSAHGGSIAAENAAGGGAVMRIRLPAARPVDDGEAVPAEADAADAVRPEAVDLAL
ncbi:PAS domain-containing protein [Ideonella sp. A 288]|uniref:sensor histidine kinase n=1 Tax=Ideonella sp. A 288 TaxID=1962181 RepID=UPI000B4AA3C4|nr:PAS domain-containing protein [Ideonella sp. A 288]